MPSRFRIEPNLRDDLTDLIDFPAVRRLPGPPLRPVNRPKISCFIRPGVPNMNVVVSQVLYIGVTGQKPKQFVDHSLEKYFPGGYERETFGEIKTQLRAENAFRARASAISAIDAGLHDVT